MSELCNTFRKEAGFVWNRMRQAALLGISLSEETLTECALYGIAASHQHQEIIVDLATKPAESKHGADWDWWFVRHGKGLHFRVQAKRLYPDGTYRALKKSGQHPYIQLDKLVSNSKMVGAYPLYCFYSFQYPQVSFHGPNACEHSYRGPSYWGCSLAFPEEVKKTGSDALKTLRPLLHPWHLIVCQSASTDLLTAAAHFVSTRRREPLPKFLAVPDQVARLIDFGDRNRKSKSRDQLTPSFWDEGTKPSEEDTGPLQDIAGLVVFRDLRE